MKNPVSMEGSGETLIVGLNWLGDAVMALPALQLFREIHPGRRLTLAVRPSVRELAACFPAVDDVVVYRPRGVEFYRDVIALKTRRFDEARILPNSLRSALVAKLAGTPRRHGFSWFPRNLLLTDPVHRSARKGLHQQFEYLPVLGLGEDCSSRLQLPQLRLPAAALDAASQWMADLPRPWWAFLPGAARGPSKRWPPGHFAALGKELLRVRGGTVVLFGGSSEADSCGEVHACLPEAVNLCGKPGFTQWMACLSLADGVVANDSGGMHVAAALGARTVGIFGLTDPAITGPLGCRCAVVKAAAAGSRDIARHSGAAIRALESIAPQVVFDTLLGIR